MTSATQALRQPPDEISYRPGKGVDDFVRRISLAEPMQLVEAERKGVADARLDEFRWLLEELRVSFFAQELRTPQPVSVKRLEKAWSLLSA